MHLSANKSSYRMRESIFSLAGHGSANDNLFDKLTAHLLALTPILQHYDAYVSEAGVVVLVLLVPYLMLRFLLRLRRMKLSEVSLAISLVLFQLFRVIDHGTNVVEVAHAAALAFYFVAAAAGCINLRIFFATSLCVSVAASLCIILQYFSYYVFGRHVQMVATSLLLPESSAWILGAQTGRAGITGKISNNYRPSAFFLEPSHMFLYLFPVLFMLLLSEKRKKSKLFLAVLLTVGMLLSTSGMAIFSAAAGWLLFLGCNDGRKNRIKLKNIFRQKNMLLCIAAIAVLAVMFLCVPFLRYSVTRIFVSVNGSSTAISGRTRLSFNLISTLRGRDLLVGVSDNMEGIDFNMPGFAAVLYKYGIVGTVLSYIFYVYSAVKTKAPYKWIAFLVLVVSFFSSHTHGTFYMLYYVLLLINGFHPPADSVAHSRVN